MEKRIIRRLFYFGGGFINIGELDEALKEQKSLCKEENLLTIP